MTLFLEIDAHGRIAAQSDEARRALADRAGRFALLPAADDLLVARRTPAAGGASARPRCVLAGDLSAFPIADFFAFIHQSRLSGALTVAASAVERSIAFKDGEVHAADSTAPAERVGEIAVRLGLVTAAQLARASADPTVPAGRALVDAGVLSAADHRRCLHEQATEVFHAILLSDSGTFHLVDGPDAPGAPLGVSTQALLMDGVRRIDEMALFRARIPGPGAALRRRAPRRPVTLRPVENQLVGLVDGRRTVAELAAAAHLSVFDATKILYHLAEAGHVEAIADGAPASGADPTARRAAIAEGVLDLHRRVLAALPADARPAALAAVRAWLADPSSRFAPLWRGLAPAPDGGLDAGAVLANLARLDAPALARLDARGDPARFLLDGLRDLLLFWLFVAADAIGRDADEALSAHARRRLDELGRGA